MKRAVAVILAASVAGCLTDAEYFGRPIDTGTDPAGDNKIPVQDGTYVSNMKYCAKVKKNDWRIENSVEMALVHVKGKEIWWNEASFELKNITNGSNGTIAHVKGHYEDISDMEYDINIDPIAKDRFIIDGAEFVYCAKLPRTPPNRG